MSKIQPLRSVLRLCTLLLLAVVTVHSLRADETVDPAFYQKITSRWLGIAKTLGVDSRDPAANRLRMASVPTTDPGHIWRLVPVDQTWVRLTVERQGTVMALDCRPTTDKRVVGLLAPVADVDTQLWMFTRVSYQLYRLSNKKYGADLVLEIYDDGAFNKLFLAPPANNVAQFWRFQAGGEVPVALLSKPLAMSNADTVPSIVNFDPDATAQALIDVVPPRVTAPAAPAVVDHAPRVVSVDPPTVNLPTVPKSANATEHQPETALSPELMNAPEPAAPTMADLVKINIIGGDAGVQVGENADLLVQIINVSTTDLQGIQLSVMMPPRLTGISGRGPLPGGLENGHMVFKPADWLPAGGSLLFRVTVQGKAAGQAAPTVLVRAMLYGEPAVASRIINVK